MKTKLFLIFVMIFLAIGVSHATDINWTSFNTVAPTTSDVSCSESYIQLDTAEDFNGTNKIVMFVACSGVGATPFPWSLDSYEWNSTSQSWVQNNTFVLGLAYPPCAGTRAHDILVDFNITGNGDWNAYTECITSTGGTLYSPRGFYWNGSKWIENTTYALGLSNCNSFCDLEYGFNVTGNNQHEMLFFVSNSARSGYYYNGSGWSSNSNVTSGLPSMSGNNYERYEFVENLTENNEIGLIRWTWVWPPTLQNTITGYIWNGTQWNSNTTQVDSLSGFGTSFDTLKVDLDNGKGTTWYGFLTNQTSKTILGWIFDDVSPANVTAITNTELYTNNSTVFKSYWEDDINLSSYIFSTNYTGSWVNDSAVSMTGTGNWSNVTKDVPYGGDFSWIIYANDSSNNWNNTGIQTWTEIQSANITNCTIISERGTYNLTKNLVGNYIVNDSGEYFCIKLLNGSSELNNVNIDGKGYSITGVNTSQSYGIWHEFGGNFTLTNLTISNYSEYGVFGQALTGSYNNFTHLIIHDIYNDGIYLNVFSGLSSPIISNNTLYNITNRGVAVSDTSTNTDYMIEDNYIHNIGSGIVTQGTGHNTIQNNNISSASLYGVWGRNNNHYDLIIGNVINESTTGIYMQTSNNSEIYNNDLKNNTVMLTLGSNIFTILNTTKTLGTNIVGGPYIGGNFWGDHVSFDDNGDYIGDDAYTVSSGNIDYLPLIETAVYNVTQFSPTNYVTTINSTINDTFDIQLKLLSDSNMYRTLNFSYGGDLANTTLFEYVSLSDQLNITDDFINNTIIIVPNSTAPSGTYSGNITMIYPGSCPSGTSYGTSTFKCSDKVDVNITITNDAIAILDLTPTSKVTTKETTEAKAETFNLSNTGTYTAKNCQATVSSVFSSFTLVTPSTPFEIPKGSNQTITVSYGSNNAGTYIGSLNVNCTVNEGENLSSSDSSSLQLSVSTPSTPPAGGGGAGTTTKETVYLNNNIEVSPSLIEKLIFYTGSLTDDDKTIETELNIVKPSDLEISVTAKNGRDGNIEDYISSIDISDEGDSAIIKTKIPHKETPKLISGKIIVESEGNAIEIPFNHRIINLGATINMPNPIKVHPGVTSPIFVEENSDGNIAGLRIWWMIAAAFLISATFISRKMKNKFIPILLLLGASALTFVWIIYS